MIGLNSLSDLTKTIRKSDLVYIAEGNISINLICAFSRLIYGTKVVRGYHNPIHYTIMPNGRKIGQISITRVYELINLLVQRLFTAIHVENTDQQKILIKYGFKKVYVVPPFIKHELFTPSEKKQNFTCLFLSRLNYHKGSDLIPEIVRRAMLDIPGISVIIAGNGLMSDEIREFANGYSNVEYMGYTDDDTRARLYSTSHVLLAPTRVEAFMLTGIEAMASGTPVISFHVPGPNDYIRDGENGFLVNNVDEMVYAISEVFRRYKSEEYFLIVKGAIETSKLYSRENFIVKMKAMIAEILGLEPTFSW